VPRRRSTGRPALVASAGDGVARWARVAASLRERLAAGEFDERFPGEAELVATYGVSRATVREAIRRLRDEGLLAARQGAGTFVLRRELDAPVLGRLGLEEMIEGAGHEASARVLRAEPWWLDAAAAARLRAPEGTPAALVERVRLAGGEPVALDRSVLLVDGAARDELLAGAREGASLYRVLAQRCGVQVSGAREWLRAGAATARVRRLLGLGASAGVLELERIAYRGESPLEWRVSVLKGEHYVFVASFGTVPPLEAAPWAPARGVLAGPSAWSGAAGGSGPGPGR
jgi:GntR family transcriptional regulator